MKFENQKFGNFSEAQPPQKGQDGAGQDGPGKYRKVLAAKSVKLPTQVKIKKFKISEIQKFETFSVSQLPRKGLSSRHSPGCHRL